MSRNLTAPSCKSRRFVSSLIKDADALKNELKNDYIITKEMSELPGGLALRCGRLLAVANAFLITAKHVDFSPDETPTITEQPSE